MKKRSEKTSDLELELDSATYSFFANRAKERGTTPEKLMSQIVERHVEQTRK